MSEWEIVSFAEEQGFGRLRNATTSEEASFGIEVWVPCDPVTARDVQDSDARRHMLLPRAGETVSVEWKLSRTGKRVPARVARLEALDASLPKLSFLAWLERMGRHLPELASWDRAEWDRIFEQLEDDLDDTVRSPEPAPPERHLAVLAWLADHGPARVREERLAWIGSRAREETVFAEAENDEGRLALSLPSPVVANLVADGLIRLVAR